MNAAFCSASSVHVAPLSTLPLLTRFMEQRMQLCATSGSKYTRDIFMFSFQTLFSRVICIRSSPTKRFILLTSVHCTPILIQRFSHPWRLRAVLLFARWMGMESATMQVKGRIPVTAVNAPLGNTTQLVACRRGLLSKDAFWLKNKIPDG